MSAPLTLGVISDTHGQLRPEAAEALRGVDRILHAGDVGTPEVLEGLRRIAPVVAVRGGVLFLNPGSAGPSGIPPRGSARSPFPRWRRWRAPV